MFLGLWCAGLDQQIAAHSQVYKEMRTGEPYVQELRAAGDVLDDLILHILLELSRKRRRESPLQIQLFEPVGYGIAERIRITAPKVPMPRGNGMKYGSVASTPYRRAAR